MRAGKLIKKTLVAIGRPIVRTVERIIYGIGKIKCKRVYFNIRWRWLVPTIFLLVVSVGGWWFYQNIIIGLPNVNEIYNPPRMSTKILDRNGNLLFKFYEDENRSWVAFDKIPQSLILATLAIEDKDYYNHHGLSFKGIAQAIYYNLFKKGDDQSLRGGSTITQQLVKNVFFSDEKTWTRKVKEAILAVMVEKKLSKNEILERYFNQVSYGGDTYGAEEAALKYFGKDVWDIDAAQAAYLAGLPAAPSSYSPFSDDPSLGFARQKHVVAEMVSDGFIDSQKATEILAEKITIINNESKIEAPHFVFYVKDFLEKEFGFNNVNRRGLTITTSLDLNIQNRVDKITKNEVEKSKGLGFSNGAALVTNPKTGEILAMTGSKDYWAKDIDGKYNVTTAERQPGSSIKPINYLLAFEKGKTLMTPIDDSAVTYNISGQKPYTPRDYTGSYLGTVTLETALASSLNIPSVKLLSENGINNMIDLAQKMGITTWNDRSRFGLSLALGAGEVKMVDMVEAYGTFANLGYRVPLNPILKIENYLGETVYVSKTEQIAVAPAEDTFLINTALSSNEARAPIFGTNSKLVIPGKTVAVKTGTTNNLKDNWCIGWTPSVMVATWVGNNDATPMSWVASGVSGATPIWNQIMTELLANKADEPWQIPSGIYKSSVCGKSNYFTNGTEKSVICPQPSALPTPTMTN